MQSLVSTQMVENAFMLTWCFKNRLPVCVNAAYSSLLICELECLHFACTQNCTGFMNIFSTQRMHILSCWNVTESFSESLHFVSLGLCS